MAEYVLDTNHADAYLRDLPGFRARIRRAVSDGHSLAITTTVLGELYARAFLSRSREANLAATEAFLRAVAIYDFDPDAAWEYGKIQSELKRQGRPLPQADVHIAAVSRARGLVLLSADSHFSFIQDLQVENWLESTP